MSIRFCVPIVICLLGFSSAWAADLNRLKVMGVNPTSGQAVIRFDDGKMNVVKVGDTIADTGAVLTQVLPDKLVASQPSEKDSSINDVLWIYRIKNPADFSSVERFEKTQPKTKQHSQSKVVTSTKQSQ